ncbi:MAG: DUF262 domain-containing protein [Bacteroidales bacterium]|jgi:hypothetical protein|nr:DUF262 domain-containing protein [Bacteroidales bacterium]
MAENKIKVASCTIAELFLEKVTCSDGGDIAGTLEIPEYQRPYCWTEKEINKLLSDIKEHKNKYGDKPMYYLGSIILHQHNGKLSIIDGQQRITTLAIMQHITDTNKVPQVKYVSPTTIEHIKANHNFLETKQDEWKNIINFENLNVTLVVTDNEDDAYTFFETQNTGGVRLSGIDIIKAHHLREISSNGKRDEHYAITWEKQRNIDTIIEQLIKARRWNVLNWVNVPSDRDEKGTKNSIIKDFSEKTLGKSKKAAYNHLIATDNYSMIKVSPYKLAIRQPLANGENFIDYLEQFAELYQRLFKHQNDAEISDEYYKFNRDIIQIIDGTAFLKELYEIAMLCYVNKFGVENVLEAAYWVFRYTYSLRVSTQKTVREDSIPAFLKRGNYVFDIILTSFNHEQCVQSLKKYKYDFNNENTDGNTVKSRFINRVNRYFGNITKNDYDAMLKKSMENKLN